MVGFGITDRLSERLIQIRSHSTACRSECLVRDLFDLAEAYADASRVASVQVLYRLHDFDGALGAAPRPSLH